MDQTVRRSDRPGRVKRNCQGRNCGAATAYDCGPSDVVVMPNPAAAGVGKPVTLKFDATPMCNGRRMFTTGKAHFGVGAGIPLDWFWRARMVAAVERAGVEQVAGPLKVMVRWGRLPARWVEQSAVTSPTGQRHPCLAASRCVRRWPKSAACGRRSPFD